MFLKTFPNLDDHGHYLFKRPRILPCFNYRERQTEKETEREKKGKQHTLSVRGINTKMKVAMKNNKKRGQRSSLAAHWFQLQETNGQISVLKKNFLILF